MLRLAHASETNLPKYRELIICVAAAYSLYSWLAQNKSHSMLNIISVT